MKVTWNWLADWVELPKGPEELAELLAMRGLPVQSMARGVSIDPSIVVGSVVEVLRHPNADRLSLCSVDTGVARLSIVCGAPNVAAGQRVAVAPVGSTLPDGTKLRKSKIRGVESEGMICSERELGLSAESEGIWALPGNPPVGAPVATFLTPPDSLLDVEVTSNRSDCMSVIGLAREIASAREVELNAMPPAEAIGKPGALPGVAIESAIDCPRYMARVVGDVRVGPSPDWLRRRLEACGIRSINNVVDATNHTLREFGQPIHAFDASKISGNAIRVRRATVHEHLALLDGRDVALTQSHLVIADAHSPMALAGIMGGRASGVTEGTTVVVLESAQFDAHLTRETARSLSIESDAATRFAQGVDPDGVAHALEATAQLILKITGGAIVAGRVDQWPGRTERPTVALSRRRLCRLLGFDVPPSVATRALCSLGFEPVGAWGPSDGDEVAIFRVPPHRKDIEIGEDLIEEVGRVVGYGAIPARLRAIPLPSPTERGEDIFVRQIVEAACGLGFHEGMNPVLVGEIPLEARDGVADVEIWEIQNPKSRELKHLRVGLLPGLIQSAARNLHRGVEEVMLVEVGKVFRAAPPPIGSERYEAGMLLAGAPDGWNRPGAEADRYLELKGAVEALLESLGIDSFRTDTYHEACWKRGTSASIEAEGNRLGTLGEISESLGNALGLEARAWAAILDVGALASKTCEVRRYSGIRRVPASKRDLAIIVSRSTHHADIESVVRSAGGALLEKLRLFDVFEGESIGPGKKSMAYALEFRSPDRTLEDREVDAAIRAIVGALEGKFSAVFRGGAMSGSTRGSKI